MSDFVRVPADSAGKRVNAHVHNDGVNDIHTQVNMIGDRNNPDQHVSVSNKGELRIIFDNGSPDFTSFGHTSVSEPNLMGAYKFYETDHSTQFSKEEISGGTVVRDVTNFGLKFTTDSTATSSAHYHSHRHFQYRPGNSIPLIFTMKSGDTGKANLIRRVGWISETTKICFEQDDTGMYAVIADTVLAVSERIHISAWNGDRLDGNGGDLNLSGQTLDVTKNNIWWIDYQYLGAGAVRFGTYVNGDKVTCHTIGHYNTLDRPWISTPNLAFGMEQENTGVTASSSEMWVFCASIVNDGYDNFLKNVVSFGAELPTLTSTTWTPIISYRPTQFKGDGSINRNRIVPETVSIITEGGSIEVVSEVNTPLNGATWTENLLAYGANLEWDIGATSIIVNGLPKTGAFVADGVPNDTSLVPTFPIQTSGINRNYDAAGSDHVTVLARLRTAGSANVGIRITVADVE